MKRILGAALLLMSSFSFAQSYPSPTFNNVTVNGTFTVVGGVPLTSLVAQAANTVIANATSSSAKPTAIAVPSCSGAGSALTWTSNTGFTCNSAINASQLGGSTFAAPAAIGSTTPNTGAFTTLSASSTVSGAGFTNYFASPPAIGSTAANTGAFTTVTSTTSGSTQSVSVTDTGVNGANLKLNGNGATTPNKTIRAHSANLEFLNSAYTTVIGILTDAGNLSTVGGIDSTAIGANTPSTGAFTTLSASGLISPSSTAGIKGTTTNDNAAVGSWAEYSATTPAGVSLSSASYVDLATLSLGAGDWAVQCTVNFNGSSLAASVVVAGINTVANTQPGATAGASQFLTFSSGVLTGATMVTPVVRESLSVTTTVRCGGGMTFSAGTVTATGTITATRRR